MVAVRVVIRWRPIALSSRMQEALNRLPCLISGHQDLMVCRNSEMMLHCQRCGYTSPGWQLSQRTPTVK